MEIHAEVFLAIIPAGIFMLTLISLFYNQSSKFLSIREHETYNAFVVRELDSIRSRILFLEQTRPTTGEIAARLGERNSFKEQIKTCQK